MVCEKKIKCEKHGMLQDTDNDGLKVIDMKLFLWSAISFLKQNILEIKCHKKS